MPVSLVQLDDEEKVPSLATSGKESKAHSTDVSLSNKTEEYDSIEEPTHKANKAVTIVEK